MKQANEQTRRLREMNARLRFRDRLAIAGLHTGAILLERTSILLCLLAIPSWIALKGAMRFARWRTLHTAAAHIRAFPGAPRAGDEALGI